MSGVQPAIISGNPVQIGGNGPNSLEVPQQQQPQQQQTNDASLDKGKGETMVYKLPKVQHSFNLSPSQLGATNNAMLINGAGIKDEENKEEMLSPSGAAGEKPATQIHFNFGLGGGHQGNQSEKTSRSTKDARLETPSKVDKPQKVQQTPIGSIKDKADGGYGTTGVNIEEEIEKAVFKGVTEGNGLSPETGIGTSPMVPRGWEANPNRINKREKRWSQQHIVEIQSSSESSPGSPVLKFEMANEASPDTVVKRSKFFNDDVQMHRDAYEKVSKYYPPNPILPKSFLVYDDSPRSGGEFAYIKLLKFRGKDLGKSKFEIEKGVNQIEFTEGVTLKSIFAPPPEAPADDRKTAYGELVYLRYALDFSVKNHQAGNRKDEVLEENLLDVRRILKNSNNTGPNQPANKESGQATNAKKGLINLQGVDTFYKKKDIFDKTLIFESRFESGNLAGALKVNDNDYHLLLQNDVNTSGHTQWFFFRVQNTKKYNQVRFNILNLSKPDSLYNEGMKVLVYSEKQSEDKDIGWHRSCQKISYYHNGIKKDHQKKGGNTKTLYTQTFTYEFLYDDDTVYFAYCYPYTYSDLIDDLTKISTDPVRSSFCTRKTLCMSLAGNKVEMLTITSKNNLENLNKRKGVFITSRVHPGESVGSWMMKGAIDFLTDENSEEAEFLRQNFVFKIIPMLNPDGVINGNYRCSLAGCDLNRRWKAPSKVLHPCIYYTKQLLQQFAKERELVVFCDFHGHSRRKNIFMYGCHNAQQPEETRLYPYLMSKICPFFSFGYSRFGNQKSKEATARIAMFNEVKIPAIYTMESSFCGMDEGPYANYHFSTDNLMQTGRDFCRTLLLFSQIQIPQNLSQNILSQIVSLLDDAKKQNDMKDMFNKDSEVEAMVQFTEKMKKLNQEKKEITTKRIRKALLQVLRATHDVATDGESSSSAGSDKAPSEDNLEPDEMQLVVPNLEDEATIGKRKKGEKKNQLLVPPGGVNTQDMTTSVSPLRRKATMQEQNNGQFKKMASSVKPKLKPQTLKKDNNDSKKNLKADDGSEKKEDEEEKAPEEAIVQSPDQDDTVTHKKKRKRNVESRDAWTQTDRSDYMLIKYRQRQKMALQMAKSQKFTKEEQALYEQALQFHKAQQLLLNKTQDMQNGAPPQSCSQPQKQTYAQGANGARVLQNMIISPEQPQNVRGSSGPAQIYKREKNSAEPTASSLNISRNLTSAQQAVTKNRQSKVQGGASILGVTGKSQPMQQINTGLANLTTTSNFGGKPTPQFDVASRQLAGISQGAGFPQIAAPGSALPQGKRKTIVNAATVSPVKPKISTVEAVGAIPPLLDMGSSSHSTQRLIVQAGTSQPNILMVVPQQPQSQTISKGARSVPTRKSVNSMQADFNRFAAAAPAQQAPPSEAANTAPVLENAYIQKKLMQQMQMEQQQQQLQQQQYGSLRQAAAYFNNSNGGVSQAQASVHHRARRTVASKDGAASTYYQQQQNPAQQQQFAVVGGTSPMKGNHNAGGVKISIVNVHNQFNIHNNYIINQMPNFNQQVPQQASSGPFFQQQPQAPPSQSGISPNHPRQQFQHMNSSSVGFAPPQVVVTTTTNGGVNGMSPPQKKGFNQSAPSIPQR